jgi:hypothetical protein
MSDFGSEGRGFKSSRARHRMGCHEKIPVIGILVNLQKKYEGLEKIKTLIKLLETNSNF